MSASTHLGLTVADLDVMPDDGKRYELIAGELYVSRAPHLVHQAAIGNLHHALRNYLTDHPLGRVFLECGLILTEHDAVIPDLLFITNDRFHGAVSGGKFVEAPDLVVEVLSSGTENERRDRSVKRHLYGKFGVREYWIANWELATLEVYELKEAGLELTATVGGSDAVTSALLPGFSIRVESIFEV